MPTSRAVLSTIGLVLLSWGGPARGDEPKVETIKSLRSDGLVMEVRDVIVEGGKRVNHGKYYLFYDNGRIHDELTYDHGDLAGP
ncbi:MAG TPA: hypothetical protein VGE52_07950, partial [Pirellulales bacterium]